MLRILKSQSRRKVNKNKKFKILPSLFLKRVKFFRLSKRRRKVKSNGLKLRSQRRVILGITLKKFKRQLKRYKRFTLVTPKSIFLLKPKEDLISKIFQLKGGSAIAYILNNWKNKKYIKSFRKYNNTKYYNPKKKRVLPYRFASYKNNYSVPNVFKNYLKRPPVNKFANFTVKFRKIFGLYNNLIKRYDLLLSQRNLLPRELYVRKLKVINDKRIILKNQFYSLYRSIQFLESYKNIYSISVRGFFQKLLMKVKYRPYKLRLIRRIKILSKIPQIIGEASYVSPTRWWRIRDINRNYGLFKKLKRAVRRQRKIIPHKKIKFRILKRSYLARRRIYKLHKFLFPRMHYYYKRLTGIVRQGNIHLNFKHNNMFLLL